MITVLGASGFIGSHLVEKLKAEHIPFYAPGRDEDLSTADLGDVIYCIGLTADFRQRPLDTVRSHVCKLLDVIETCTYHSLLYLSSTRLYEHSDGSTSESAYIQVNPLDSSDLYNISKLMGESVVLNNARNGKVARISNVYGPILANEHTFLSMIIKMVARERKIVLQSDFASAKDYISIDDVILILQRIALNGQHAIYNLASGVNVTHAAITQRIADLTGCPIEVEPGSPKITFPPINTQRIQQEFVFQPRLLLDDIEAILASYENARVKSDDHN